VETRTIAQEIDSQSSHITLKPAQLIPQQVINDFISAWNNIFGLANAQVTTDGRELCRRCREGKESLESYISEYNEKARKAGNNLFAKPIVEAINAMEGWKLIRDPKNFFDNIIAKKDAGRALIEEAKKCIKFVDSQMANFNKVLDFIEKNRINFTCLPADKQLSVQTLLALKQDPLPTMQTYGQLMRTLEQAIKTQQAEYRKQILEAYQSTYQKLYAICDQNNIEYTFLPDMTQLVETKQKEENLLLLKQNANTMEFFNKQQMFIINEHNERIRKTLEQNNKDNDTENIDDVQNDNPTPQISVVIEPLALSTPSKVLRTEAEVDTYIADLKAQIMAKLKEGEQAVMVMQN
jgi:hypothetical protein